MKSILLLILAINIVFAEEFKWIRYKRCAGRVITVAVFNNQAESDCKKTPKCGCYQKIGGIFYTHETSKISKSLPGAVWIKYRSTESIFTRKI